MLLRGAMQVGECVQLVHQLRHAPSRVLADVELTRIVADNHHLAEQPMRLDAAPQRFLRWRYRLIRRALAA